MNQPNLVFLSNELTLMLGVSPVIYTTEDLPTDTAPLNTDDLHVSDLVYVVKKLDDGNNAITVVLDTVADRLVLVETVGHELPLPTKYVLQGFATRYSLEYGEEGAECNCEVCQTERQTEALATPTSDEVKTKSTILH